MKLNFMKTVKLLASNFLYKSFMFQLQMIHKNSRRDECFSCFLSCHLILLFLPFLIVIHFGFFLSIQSRLAKFQNPFHLDFICNSSWFIQTKYNYFLLIRETYRQWYLSKLLKLIHRYFFWSSASLYRIK